MMRPILGVSLPTREEMQEIELATLRYMEPKAYSVIFVLHVAAQMDVGLEITLAMAEGCVKVLKDATSDD